MFLPSLDWAYWHVLVLFAVGLSACQTESPEIVRPSPLPQDERIQVYMNHEPSSSYTEPYRRQTRDGDNLEQIIIDTIASARSTVEVAVQELRLPGIVQALADRHQAGVKVRVILENIYSRPYSQFTEDEVARLPSRERDRYQEARRLIDLDSDGQISHSEARQRDALVMLADAQIPQIDDTADGSAGSNLMHDKFVVVDGRTVVLTSANFTTSDVHGDFKAAHSRGNANNLLKIDSPELAHLFIEEFNFMWGDGPGGQLNSRFGIRKSFRPARQVIVGSTLVEVQFSPTSRSIDWTRSSNGLISKILSDAQQSISMALFVFSDQSLVNHLDKVRKRGVAIKTLIDPGFAYRSYSEAMDMMGITLVEDCQFEPNNRPWQPAIATVGVPRMTPGDLLHHKFGIVDHQTVITGSHNWTDAANVGNDETVLVIHNSAVTAHYQREFERLYRNAILGIPPVIQKKADAQRQKCGSIQARIPAKKTIPNHLINLNTATQAELEDLPGVGPSLAKRIIAARQSKRFTSLADLDHVSGVGPKLLRKLEKHVTW